MKMAGQIAPPIFSFLRLWRKEKTGRARSKREKRRPGALRGLLHSSVVRRSTLRGRRVFRSSARASRMADAGREMFCP